MAFALEELTERIIGCGIAVHRGPGGGLLESCYDAAMCVELGEQGLHFVRQPLVPVVYKERSVGQCRPDFIIEKQVVLELKCTARYDPVSEIRFSPTSKGTGLRVGLLMNFHAVTLRGGLRRFDLKGNAVTVGIGLTSETSTRSFWSESRGTMWVATQDLPRGAAHPFYARLNQILDQDDFDGFVEGRCQRFYADEGRPGLPPGRYFRLLLIGYFEGSDAERAIAWRAADSFALREFLGLVLPEAPPDHSTISRTRRLIDLETHEAVFTWLLQRLADAGLVRGKTVGVDATTLEANAALRSIVRRDTGKGYQDFLAKHAQASGIETPTRADLARIDRKRKKKGSNDDWAHPHDPDAKITKCDPRVMLSR